MAIYQITADPGDKEYPTNRLVYVVWALGRLDENKEPNFHDVYPKGNLRLELNRQEPETSCMDFTENDNKLMYEITNFAKEHLRFCKI